MKGMLYRWQRTKALYGSVPSRAAILYGLCIVLALLLLRERLSTKREAVGTPYKPTLNLEDMTEGTEELFVAPPGRTADAVQSERTETQGASITPKSASGVKPKGPLVLGKHMCIIQPVKSPERSWSTDNVKDHVALKAFLASFVESVDPVRDRGITFTLFYGYDVHDPVFSQSSLHAAFHKFAREMTSEIPVEFRFRPLFGLDGRLTGIWNDLARSAYNHGCDYFFMSNDDMALYTKGWASEVIHSFETSKYRRCKYLGIVRFQDKWAKWALFTFHVSSRLHMEIFDETYYRVPYYNSHNDLWIHYVYRHVGSNLNKAIQVRNRVNDFRSPSSTEEARYQYDKKEKKDFNLWKDKGREILQEWIDNAGERCVPTH